MKRYTIKFIHHKIKPPKVYYHAKQSMSNRKEAKLKISFRKIRDFLHKEYVTGFVSPADESGNSILSFF